MRGFAERTGLSSESPAQRYLWTDAFAVCNYLALARRTHDSAYVELALRLVSRVHHVLGQHRPDDAHHGWLSGLAGDQAEAHPTRGGLRIGKPLPERSPEEPLDDDLEWERDGQYFHYLTQWMHALDQAARWTGQPRLNAWARELAETAHRAFVRRAQGRTPRLYWKMSVDLSRPLVASMGQHDPLDGFVACAELGATGANPELEKATADFESMIARHALATADPLGLGGLLSDACRIEQLIERGALAGDDLLDTVLGAALDGLAYYSMQIDLGRPAGRRLAFRELGLVIGLAGIQAGLCRTRAPSLAPYTKLGAAIQAFWLDPRNRSARTWTEHQDINDVMLATSLVPEGYLSLQPMPLAS